VTPAGVVKVLDFGLAKEEEPSAGGGPAESPTAMVSPTRSGVILGTAAYMSPEQASGKIADRRSDVWAFGVVLYEMLAGKRAFPGESVTEILAGVLRGEPDWSALPAATPFGIRKLLRRCLERERKQRLQAIGDARFEIEAALAEESASVSGLIKRHQKAVIGSIAVLAALVAMTWFLPLHPPKPSAELTQKRLTFTSSDEPVQSESISPDGKYLGYSDQAGIHLKLLSTGEERLIRRPSGVPAGAYWSIGSWFPDGAQLLATAYEPGGHESMWTVSVLGQTPRELREDGLGWEVSPDGTHIAFGRSRRLEGVREIWMMGSQGDNPQKVLAVGENEWLQLAHWSPDGQRLAYVRGHRFSESFQNSIETCDLKGANRTAVVSLDTDMILADFCWLPEGRIIYARPDTPNSGDSNLWQAGIDNHAGTSNGKPKRITSWAGANLTGFSASADGKRLVILKQTDHAQVYVGELAAGGTRMKSLRRLTNNESDDYSTAWTADSKAVLFMSDRNGTWGVYKQEISEETAVTLFVGPQDVNVSVRPSPDGAWVLFIENPAAPNQPSRILRIPAGGGIPQFVLEIQNPDNFACARAPASRCVIFERRPDQKQLVITAFDPVKGRGKVLRTIERDHVDSSDQSALSPDGSIFAISRPREPMRLLSLAGGSDREITVKGWPNLTNMDWSSDGKGLYCGSHSPQGSTLLYVDLAGNARVLWQYKGALWQHPGGAGEVTGIASPDGRHLAIGAAVTNSSIWIIEGF